ncbi:MAG: thiol:disulfide interchange protein DsbC [Psychroserpens sp.]|jgi:thiol:disulfide interchange protein DsbC
MKIILIFILITMVSSLKSHATDIDSQMQQAMDSFRSSTQLTIKGISRTPTPGFFIALTNNGIMPFNYDGKLLLTKDKAFHADVKGPITGDALKEIRREALSEIDLESIIVIKHGTGTEKIIQYSAIDCPYCFRQESVLSNMSFDASLYLVPTALDKANWPIVNQIMCSNDRASAWSNYMLNSEIPNNDGKCYWSDNYSSLGTNAYRTIVLQTFASPQMIYGDGIVRSFTQKNPLAKPNLAINESTNFFNPSTIKTSYFSKDVYKPKKKKMFGIF